MNYLAHLYLGDNTDQALVGNLLGDFVKGRIDPAQWPPAMAQGILLHRLIDSFTDAHPIVIRSKSRFSSDRRRFAGIIVDVCYDHFLARHWHRFSAEPLPPFTARVYQALRHYHGYLPPRLRQIAPRMERENWLYSYRQFDTASFVLDRIAQRFKRPTPLQGAGQEAALHYEALEADFLAFFPDAICYARAKMTT
ncbi:hypothetical protein CAI21_17690 [Alkalilimnicola ehrlichii]|uniref:ACP phosphodiesterase n=1 Tax=Alkalilimnicola ehrlichii TaxID=351052 RepID=A0A3E0WHA3_9GAMM|nr:ACP phosphodiesterase [Alkalilimnicola ehrlichii]RFA26162.1 hypothetical protein CAI21_17690 [Alkalilimnicola ehrlichii]RFA32342.1 hypothetical protein CAL65_19855 [Alkalilimnicola ehrlichii]